MVTIVGGVLLLAIVIVVVGFLWLGISLLVGITVSLKRRELGHPPHIGDD